VSNSNSTFDEPFNAFFLRGPSTLGVGDIEEAFPRTIPSEVGVTGRKILWVLGAGAPRGAGARRRQGNGWQRIPTQEEFWPQLLHVGVPQSDRLTLLRFMFRHFLGYGKVPPRTSFGDRLALIAPVNVEEVFTYVSERLLSPAVENKAIFEEVWTILRDATRKTFAQYSPNKRTRSAFSAIGDLIRTRDAVVSFNYDPVCEESLPGNLGWYYFLEGKQPGLPILKPHGSANWSVVSRKVIVDQDAGVPLIVPPTHLKFLASAGGTGGLKAEWKLVQPIWTEMDLQLRMAKAFVFVGYSFPPADLYFSSVLRMALAGRDHEARLVLVNPDAVALRDRLCGRFGLGPERVRLVFDLDGLCRMERRELWDF
jgi:hypothetical protein